MIAREPTLEQARARLADENYVNVDSGHLYEKTVRGTKFFATICIAQDDTYVIEFE